MGDLQCFHSHLGSSKFKGRKVATGVIGMGPTQVFTYSLMRGLRSWSQVCTRKTETVCGLPRISKVSLLFSKEKYVVHCENPSMRLLTGIF